MKTTTACAGCCNNFYNGNNDLGVKRCWSADDAKVITRYRIHMNTLPHQKHAFLKVKLPDCYGRREWAYYNKLPDFVKASDLARANNR